MEKKLTKIPLQDGRVRYRAVITSDACEADSAMARVIQFQMLSQLAETQELAYVGPGVFQKMTMQHNGESWVIELESVTKVNKE